MAAVLEANRLRSSSTSSTLSCINVVATEELPDTSALSSTPPTSVTDVASIGSDKTQSKPDRDVPNRIRRVRTSVPTYNENVLSGSRRTSGGKASANASSKTPTASKKSSHDRLVASSLAALDMDWEIGTLPGEQLKESLDQSSSSARPRNQTFGNAAMALSKTASVLGKRSRSAFESGKIKVQRAGKRTSKRLRALETASKQEPPTKKTRLTEEKAAIEAKEEASAKKAAAKPMRTRASDKKFLAQGLYIGQEPDFDPRFTEEKNKKRRSAKGSELPKVPKILPPPMFLGKRLLEHTRGFRLPYNIFNPLPPGQPKPDEWRRTGKNVFVGEAGDLWKKSEKMEHSMCLCTPETGCGEDCMNRYMFYECDNTNCAVGPEFCTNRAFADIKKRVKAGGKYRIGVEVIKTRDRGYGVRANRCFEPGQIIVEYTGEIITQQECDQRMKARYKNNECFYLMEFDQNMIIDATRGSIARFVNHSCEPNSRMTKWTVAGKPRMALFAGDKGIMTGEELSYDYNFDPFSSKNTQECRCGAASCRGVLGPRVTRDKEPRDALAPLTQPVGAKRKLAEVAGNAAQAANNMKRRKIAPASRAVSKAVSKAVVKPVSKAVVKPVSKKFSDVIARGSITVATKSNTRAIKGAVKRSAPNARKAVVAVKKRAVTVKKAAAKQVARGKIVVATTTSADQARLVKKASQHSLAGVMAAKSADKKQTTLTTFARRGIRAVAE